MKLSELQNNSILKIEFQLTPCIKAQAHELLPRIPYKMWLPQIFQAFVPNLWQLALAGKNFKGF